MARRARCVRARAARAHRRASRAYLPRAPPASPVVSFRSPSAIRTPGTTTATTGAPVAGSSPGKTHPASRAFSPPPPPSSPRPRPRLSVAAASSDRGSPDRGARPPSRLFRRVASRSSVAAVAAKYARDDPFPLRGVRDPAVVAGALRRYLDELPEPILGGFRSCDAVLAVAAVKEEKETGEGGGDRGGPPGSAAARRRSGLGARARPSRRVAALATLLERTLDDASRVTARATAAFLRRVAERDADAAAHAERRSARGGPFRGGRDGVGVSEDVDVERRVDVARAEAFARATRALGAQFAEAFARPRGGYGADAGRDLELAATATATLIANVGDAFPSGGGPKRGFAPRGEDDDDENENENGNGAAALRARATNFGTSDELRRTSERAPRKRGAGGADEREGARRAPGRHGKENGDDDDDEDDEEEEDPSPFAERTAPPRGRRRSSLERHERHDSSPRAPGPARVASSSARLFDDGGGGGDDDDGGGGGGGGCPSASVTIGSELASCVSALFAPEDVLTAAFDRVAGATVADVLYASDVRSMPPAALLAEKTAVKRRLRSFDSHVFARDGGRRATKEDKRHLRPMYLRLAHVKRRIAANESVGAGRYRAATEGPRERRDDRGVNAA